MSQKGKVAEYTKQMIADQIRQQVSILNDLIAQGNEFGLETTFIDLRELSLIPGMTYDVSISEEISY